MATSSNWELLAKNHIPGRDWDIIKNIWTAASLGFDPVDIPDLSQTLDPIVGADFDTRETASIFEFHGGKVAAFHDAMSALIKCAYVLRTVGNCLLGGQPTWASVDTYHFSLVACRALLGFLGVHFVQVRGTPCVLDVFPEGRLDQVKRKFQKVNPTAQNPARLIFRAKSGLIDQRAMWTILIRVLRVAVLPVDLAADIDKICELEEGFSRSRNDVLYRNSSWLYAEDFLSPTCKVSINDDIFAYADMDDFFSDQRDANFAFANVLARVLLFLSSDIQAQGGVNLLQNSYGPCLLQFAGFSVGKIDALFSTMYRKEAYGIDI